MRLICSSFTLNAQGRLIALSEMSYAIGQFLRPSSLFEPKAGREVSG